MIIEQAVKSTIAHFNSFVPMNAYVQKMPEGVQYPCYLVNKCDVTTRFLNSFYFINTVTLYVRIFGKDEVDLKNTAYTLVNSVFANHCKIPILDKSGTPTSRYLRVENIESIDIPTDQNEIYCQEINFSFDTQHIVNIKEFDLLTAVNLNICK